MLVAADGLMACDVQSWGHAHMHGAPCASHAFALVQSQPGAFLIFLKSEAYLNGEAVPKVLFVRASGFWCSCLQVLDRVMLFPSSISIRTFTSYVKVLPDMLGEADGTHPVRVAVRCSLHSCARACGAVQRWGAYCASGELRCCGSSDWTETVSCAERQGSHASHIMHPCTQHYGRDGPFCCSRCHVSWQGILTAEGRRVISTLTYNVFSPCLFLTTLGNGKLLAFLQTQKLPNPTAFNSPGLNIDMLWHCVIRSACSCGL